MLSYIVTSPRGNASRAFAITYGARDIDSTPPAITRSASPDGDRSGGLDDRHQPRPAQSIDRPPRHARRQPGQQRAHPRHVAVVLAGLVRAPEQHVVDGGAGHPAASNELGDDHRAEIIGPHLRERPAVAAEWRPDRVDHEHLSQRPEHRRRFYSMRRASQKNPSAETAGETRPAESRIGAKVAIGRGVLDRPDESIGLSST